MSGTLESRRSHASVATAKMPISRTRRRVRTVEIMANARLMFWLLQTLGGI